jgi:hypothetical protein
MIAIFVEVLFFKGAMIMSLLFGGSSESYIKSN